MEILLVPRGTADLECT